MNKLFLQVLYVLFLPCILYGETKSGICLVVLVENHAEIIESCLKSAREVIDCVCICDIGSEDETLFNAEEFLTQHHIPSTVVSHPWVDFAHNRTLSVNAGKETLEKSGFDPKSSYLLILDPEMQLKSSPDFQKNSLREDGYFILEHSFPLGSSSYSVHLLRASLPWQSIGIASENWSCEQTHHIAELPSLRVEESVIDTEKLQKKAESLKAALKIDTNNSQYLFYLAQIQLSLNDPKNAVQNFHSSLSLTQGNEQIWFCKFMLGQSYERLGEWDKALYWYLEAYQTNPDRAESLQKLATYYRYKGMNDLAYIFARHGSKIPPYNHPLLSPLPPLYDYQFEEELSIAAFYTRFKNEGEEANLHLILRRDVPDYLKNQAYCNALFYVRPLPDTFYIPIQIDLPFIQEGFDERYHPMNPTIQKTKNGYKVICRAVNYTQTGAKLFNTIDSEGVFRTKNFLLHYDPNFNLQSQAEIIENLPRRRIRTFNLEGVDDCRLFEFQNRSWFTCTTNDTNPTGNFQISLCKLSETSSQTTIFVDKLIPLQGPDPYRCEKNWLPFVVNDVLYVIYSCDPFTIYQIDPDTGSCTLTKQSSSPLDFSRFRGSAPPIAWGKGYLLLVHEVVFHPNYERTYLHRFLFLDSEFNIERLSDPFYFRHQGVEFCCGMQTNHSEEHLILTIGSEDREAFFCRVPIKTIQSLLKTP